MAQTDVSLYPFIFEPIYLEKVWGGRRLERFGRALPGGADTLIGESWELCDMAGGSPGGAGAEPRRSVVSNGPLRGKTLQELIRAHGQKLLGRLELDASGDFPILIKLLDAGTNVSVQVHPTSDYVRQNPGTHVKSEAWYILDAEPGAVLYKGIRDGVTADQFRAAIESGDASAVRQTLIELPARAGDCHYLASGTCHALGAGIVIAEVQTPSDTTFRVFDWGRTDRQLHVEKAMKCIQFGPPDVAAAEKRSHIAGMFTTVSRLVACDHFRIEKVRMVQSYEQELPYDQPAVWIVLEGAGRIDPGNGAAPVLFRGGQTLLVPAEMTDARVVLDQDTIWLEVTFPQAWPEQIA